MINQEIQRQSGVRLDHHKHAQIPHHELHTNNSIQLAESAARKKQLRILKHHLAATINTNFEIWADHEQEGRRLPGDIFSLPSLNVKRSDVEVKRYKTVINHVEDGNHQTALLFELIHNWSTATNLEHLAHLLSYTPEELEELILELDSNKLTDNKASAYAHPLDKTQHWYITLLDCISEDDIVPLVMMRNLLLQSKVKPSLKDIFIGLERYLEREVREVGHLAAQPHSNGDDPNQLAFEKLNQLKNERDHLYQELRKFCRHRKSSISTPVPSSE